MNDVTRQPRLDWPQYMQAMVEATQQPLLARFYQADWPGPDTPLRDVEFVALDIETTGLDARHHAIVSIGLIPFTLARIRSDQAWQQLVRPQSDLLAESVVFHHITHSDIRRAPRFAEILEDLLERLSGRIAVVHYRNIERAFIDQAVQQVLGEGLMFPMIDTMQIEAQLYPRRQPGWLKRLLGKQPISIRLADSRTRYGLPLYQAHHALTDALGTAELLQAQVATHFSAECRLGDVCC
ncbi:3'-5' exonuclease [Halopseudomonas xiamenensis]|uniref:3'-5' exonuclease n=1 Tax=Halopseudomonas xiamenensis TaxID=157792 RepID=UPI0016264C34|nr:3'-5' exonuclease [Halopseudomonas xiamenensis]